MKALEWEWFYLSNILSFYSENLGEGLDGVQGKQPWLQTPFAIVAVSN